MLVRSKHLAWRMPVHAAPLRQALSAHPLTFRAPAHAAPLRKVVRARGMMFRGNLHGTGFIAGRGEGIVTVGGQPAARQVLLFDRRTLKFIRSEWSNDDGTYLIDKLNPEMDYLVMAVDHKRQYEPVVYDFVKPALPDSG